MEDKGDNLLHSDRLSSQKVNVGKLNSNMKKSNYKNKTTLNQAQLVEILELQRLRVLNENMKAKRIQTQIAFPKFKVAAN